MLRVRTRAAWPAAVVAVLAVAATAVVMDRWYAGAAPGDDDATFVPTAGCRLTDTRRTTNVGPRATPLGPGETMEVAVHGSNGECTGPLAIPADATAVALNATVVDATAASNIRLFPADLADVPLLSNLNVTAGAPPTPNKVDVELSSDGRLKVFNFQGSVNVVLDVVGFYAPTSLRTLAAQAGTPGPTGPQGPPGPPGPAGEIVMSHGMGPTAANSAEPPDLVHFVELVRVAMPVADTYQTHLPLTGPGDARRLGVRVVVDRVLRPLPRRHRDGHSRLRRRQQRLASADPLGQRRRRTHRSRLLHGRRRRRHRAYRRPARVRDHGNRAQRRGRLRRCLVDLDAAALTRSMLATADGAWACGRVRSMRGSDLDANRHGIRALPRARWQGGADGHLGRR